jgi:hypothetical protein
MRDSARRAGCCCAGVRWRRVGRWRSGRGRRRQRTHRWRVGAPVSRRGRVRLLDRSSAPRRVPGRTDEQRVEVIASLRRLWMTGAEIAECLRMALSTVSGILTRIGLGSSPQPLSALPSGRALGRIGQVDADTERPATVAPGSARAALAGSSCTSASTTRPASRTSKSSTTRRPHRGRFPQTRSRVLQSTRDRGTARDDPNGNPYRSALHRDRVPGAQAQAPTHSPLPASHQRQGRALCEDPPRRLDVRRRLPLISRTQAVLPRLGRLVQHPTTHTAHSATSRPSLASTSRTTWSGSTASPPSSRPTCRRTGLLSPTLPQPRGAAARLGGA